MGRTSRNRSKRQLAQKAKNIENEETTINLMKWLVQNNWKNESHLKLRNFPQTGRGVTSSKQIKENDILITVPCDLMITYNSLQENLPEVISPHGHGLKIHDLLTLFLIIEKERKKSLWKAYIDSLPVELPVLPWLAILEEIKFYPEDMQIICEKNRENFIESMSRVKKSIKKQDGCVFDENLFKWGYVLVNTRAVYVDPQIFAANATFLERLLIDQPSMALCPYLDMFNHHFLANTEARVIEKEGKLVYQLQTHTKYQKYEQIFISYGAHDNIKLLMEYGFFIPGNILDQVEFDLLTIFGVFNTTLDQRRYKFILNHGFNESLYIGYNDVSYNLKAVLFVLFCEDCKSYSSVIFGDAYPQDFLKNVPMWTLQLLDYKLKVFDCDYKKLKAYGFVKSESAKLMASFLQYRIDFVNDLKKKFGSNY